MKHVALRSSRRPRHVAVGLLTLLLTACTGRGGGQLPPDTTHDGSASFGFSFNCEDKGGVNPPTGELRIELSFTERSTRTLPLTPLPGLPPLSPLPPFTIHGVADQLDPVLESAYCLGQNPPPGGNELIFLGRYRYTAGGVPTSCPDLASTTTSCRFEVIVRDNDQDRAPSSGDFFKITLSSASALTSRLDPASIFYTRAGVLSSGNLTVD